MQRSIELLDRVLSEFDDVENANQVQNVSRCNNVVGIACFISSPILVL